MDAFIDSTIQLLIEWGLPGLFISALLAGSIVPFSSELVLVALVKLGLPPIACLISATLGNTVGGMTCYYMGRLGKISWIEKYFKVKKEKVDKMVKFLQGKGALMVLLHLSSRHWGSDSHCTGIYAKQHMAHHSFHVCRQTDTLYSSPVCTRKCLGRYSRVRILNIG